VHWAKVGVHIGTIQGTSYYLNSHIGSEYFECMSVSAILF
jgi:hypothetical protein